MIYRSNHALLFLLLSTVFVIFSQCENASEQDSEELLLWYAQPAQAWTEALPIGNGRIGGMVFGGTEKERIQFNEESLWTGKPRDYSREGAVEYLDEIRQLLAEGRQAEAEDLAGRHFMGKRSNEENYPRQKEEWLKKVRQKKHLKYADPNYDDSSWPLLEVPSRNGWERVGLDAVDGAIWFRYSFEAPADWSGKKLILELGQIRETDHTYFNGEYLGSEDNRKTERVYEVPSSLVKDGKNVIAVQVLNFQDKGGFVGLRDSDKPMMIYPANGDRSRGVRLDNPWKYYEQDLNPPTFPEFEEAYQPFGDIWLEFAGHDSADNYRRQLDITNAVSSVSYTVDNVDFRREYFVSAPDQALVVRITASEPGKLNFDVALNSPHRTASVERAGEKSLKLTVPVKNGALTGVSFLKIESNGGLVEASDDQIKIEDADEAILYLTAATNFVRFDDVSGKPEQLAFQDLTGATSKSFERLKNDHIKDYRQYFDTFSIDFGPAGSNSELTTKERIEQFANTNDPAFVALYVQYGRYLMISTSRPGTMPPNLQGIWNDLLTPPWDSKYTTNINLEMNYWPAEILNLSELHKPLFKLTEEVAEQGAETAEEHYGADGWVLHHNTDIWRATGPVNASNHGIWVTGGAWLCHHLWDHFQYTGDTTFLQIQAYPLMKGAAEFFVDFLTTDPETGWLISTPSNSPETGGLVAGPTMDHQLIRSLFQNTIEASKLLGTDVAFRDTLQDMVGKIAPNQIGKYGQLQEWLADIDDPENHHRHVSHLWGVYPGNEINIHTPELLDAAKQSLLFRGDEGTGWSLAWKINLWARFRDGNHAYELVKVLLSPAWGERDVRGGSYVNLFDAHPPFQIDGNFGAAAGIAEMLVQSHGGEIVILPALPDALPNGKVSGLKARGGFVLDLEWKNGKMSQLKINSALGGPGTLLYGDKKISLDMEKGQSYVFDGELNAANSRKF